MAGDGEGVSEIIDFVLYMFVLGPSVEWCLKSPKINGSRPGSLRGIALAIALLAAIAGTKLSFELVGRESNHFSTLGVRTDATANEIKRAYRDVSLICTRTAPLEPPRAPRAGRRSARHARAPSR